MEEHRAAILIVDDEESIRDILCRKLMSLGYQCEVAADGNEALWKAFMQDFDLVLMDIKMPGLSGMEVLPKIVTDHPDTCVIMLTAVSDIQTAVEAMKLGAFDYLTKPFNLDDLVMRVQRALERRRLVLENREYQRRLELKVEQQAGRIRQYHTEAEQALNREQAALAELDAARVSSIEEDSTAQGVEEPASKPGIRLARKLTQLLGNKSPEELGSDSVAGVAQAKVTNAEEQPRSSSV
jgi:DNA-binding NtrC family response regulator